MALKLWKLQSKAEKVLVNMFLRYDPYYRMIYDFHQNKQYSTLKHLTVLEERLRYGKTWA